MHIDLKKGEKKIILSREEKDIIKRASNIIDKFENDKKLLIENSIQHILYSGLVYPNPQILNMLNTNISLIVGEEVSTLLLNAMRFSENSKLILNEFINEKIITHNVSQFLFELAIKYGQILDTILLNIQRPNHWNRIESDLLVINNELNLKSKIWRIDGSSFEFNVALRDSIILATHFISRTIEIIEQTEKQKVLEINEESINNLKAKLLLLEDSYLTAKSSKNNRG